MEGVCKLCGCTDDNPCVSEEGPCSWVTSDLCSACCVVLEGGRLLIPKQCRYCDLVVEGEPYQGRKTFTCSRRRFDGSEVNPPAHQWYAWSGISRPNKRVAEAQKECPFFEVHRSFN